MRYISNFGGLEVMLKAEGGGVLMAFCDARGFGGCDEADGCRWGVLVPLVHLYGKSAAHLIDYTDFCWGDVIYSGRPEPSSSAENMDLVRLVPARAGRAGTLG